MSNQKKKNRQLNRGRCILSLLVYIKFKNINKNKVIINLKTSQTVSSMFYFLKNKHLLNLNSKNFQILGFSKVKDYE